MPSKTKRGMWTNEVSKVTMDVIERGTHSQRRPYKSWKIPMSFLVDYLNRKTKSKKMGPKRVFIKKEDAILIKWTLDMQECGLSISLQQLDEGCKTNTNKRYTIPIYGIPNIS
jgi:hypothetical protein